MTRPLTFFGDRLLVSGTYLLHMAVAADSWVVYGRYQQGTPIHTPTGQYLYIGSALGKKGSSSLPRRLLRHATRAAEPPHPIQQPLADHFRMEPPTGKRLRWHVDYLLEETAVTIQHITLIHSTKRLESEIARILNHHLQISPLAPGLGATDDPGLTHILQIHDLSLPDIHALLPL